MVPVSYSYRNLVVRWKTTLMTASGFTLVVTALIVMLAFVNGVETVCATSGEPENVIVLTKGNNDEVLSQLGSSLVSQVESTKGVARDASGRPLASRELFMVVHHFDESTEAFQFLQVRGVLPVATQVHTQLQLAEGEMFRPGQSELIVGRGVQREHDLQLGDQLLLGRKKWTVAGIFDAGGSTFESEIWCDLSELASQFRRQGVYSSVVLRTEGPAAAEDLADRLADSRSVSVEAKPEVAYYAKQSEQTAFIVTAAWIIAWFMGIGAIFGVMNTMFAAIGQRIKDIAVLRILGFKAYEILLSFLLESILIGCIGGAIGALLGMATNGLTRSTAIGAREVEFAFRVDAQILIFAGAFSIVIAVLGGLLPAMSAMRIRPLEALR